MSCKWYARYQRTDRHSSLLLAGRLAVIGEWGDSKRPQPAAATKLVNLSRLDNIYWWLQIWKPERGPTDPSSCMINLRSDPRARANHYLDARFYSLGCGCWLLASCERVLGWSLVVGRFSRASLEHVPSTVHGNETRVGLVSISLWFPHRLYLICGRVLPIHDKELNGSAVIKLVVRETQEIDRQMGDYWDGVSSSRVK